LLIDGGDRIARILAENARAWEEETYLPKLAQADAKLASAIANFVHRNRKEASNEITSLVKDRQRAWRNLHGVVAVGMYEFYEHVWAKLRDTDGFEPYEFRLDQLTLVLRVFLDDQKRPVELEERESRWVSEKVTEIFKGYVDDIEPRRAQRLQQAAKKESNQYQRCGSPYRGLVAVLDNLSEARRGVDVYNTLEAPGSLPTAKEIAEYFIEHIRKPCGYKWNHRVIEQGAGTGNLKWALVLRTHEYDVDVLVWLEVNSNCLLSFT
jgi:hypothetical protein